MIDAYYDGCEIVYRGRSNRDTDTFLTFYDTEFL